MEWTRSSSELNITIVANTTKWFGVLVNLQDEDYSGADAWLFHVEGTDSYSAIDSYVVNNTAFNDGDVINSLRVLSADVTATQSTITFRRNAITNDDDEDARIEKNDDDGLMSISALLFDDLSSVRPADFPAPIGIKWLQDFGVPGVPDIPEKANSTDESIAVFWHAPDSGIRVTEYVLQIEGDGEGWVTVYIGPAKVKVVSDLKPSTGYRFRVAAKNECGQGEFSEPMQEARTNAHPDTIPSSPQGLKLNLPGPTWLSIVWEPPTGSTVTGYQLLSSKKPSPTDADFAVVYTGSAPNYIMGGLESNSSIWFAVKAVNAIGSSDLSPPVKMTTLRYEHSVCVSNSGYCLEWALDSTFEYGHFRISAPVLGWMALTIESDDGAMRNGDCWVTWVSNDGEAYAVDYFSDGYVKPTIDISQDLGYVGGTQSESQDKNPSTTVWFSRKFNTGDMYDWNKWASIADGDSLRRFGWAMHDTDDLVVHKHNNRGRMKVDLITGKLEVLKNESKWIHVHMWILLVTWCFFGQFGPYIAFYASRVAGSTTDYFKTLPQKWFHVHRSLQVLTVLCTLIGVGFGIKYKMDVGGPFSFHAVTGFLFVFLLLCQAVGGFCFSTYISHFLHRYLGRFLVLAILLLQIPTGLSMAYIPSGWLPYTVVIVFWLGLYVATAVYMRIKSEMAPIRPEDEEDDRGLLTAVGGHNGDYDASKDEQEFNAADHIGHVPSDVEMHTLGLSDDEVVEFSSDDEDYYRQGHDDVEDDDLEAL